MAVETLSSSSLIGDSIKNEQGEDLGTVKEIMLKCRIDTAIEIEYIEHGGVLHYVLRNLAQAA